MTANPRTTQHRQCMSAPACHRLPARYTHCLTLPVYTHGSTVVASPWLITGVLCIVRSTSAQQPLPHPTPHPACQTPRKASRPDTARDVGAVQPSCLWVIHTASGLLFPNPAHDCACRPVPYLVAPCTQQPHHHWRGLPANRGTKGPKGRTLKTTCPRLTTTSHNQQAKP